jgi:hypothetical protein
MGKEKGVTRGLSVTLLLFWDLYWWLLHFVSSLTPRAPHKKIRTMLMSSLVVRVLSKTARTKRSNNVFDEFGSLPENRTCFHAAHSSNLNQSYSPRRVQSPLYYG